MEFEIEVEVGCYLWRWSSAINRALNLSFDLSCYPPRMLEVHG